MLFNSLTFILVFLPSVVLAAFVLRHMFGARTELVALAVNFQEVAHSV